MIGRKKKKKKISTFSAIMSRKKNGVNFVCDTFYFMAKIGERKEIFGLDRSMSEVRSQKSFHHNICFHITYVPLKLLYFFLHSIFDYYEFWMNDAFARQSLHPKRLKTCLTDVNYADFTLYLFKKKKFSAK